MLKKIKDNFRGFKDVLSFTYTQNIKMKSFKISTIITCLLFLIIFSLINILPVVIKDIDFEDEEIIETQLEETNLYVVNNTDYDMIDINNFVENIKNEYIDYKTEIKIIDLDLKSTGNENADLKKVEKFLENKSQSGVLSIEKKANIINLVFYFSETQSEYMYNLLSEELIKDFDDYLYKKAGLNEYELNSDIDALYTSAIEIKIKEQEQAVEIIRIILPMLVSFIMYMLVLVYGQSITKSIMTERSSKLLETLLLNVKPYSVIAGKIVAMTIIALTQIVSFVLAGFIGNNVGYYLAKLIDDSHKSPIGELLKILSKSGLSDIFSPLKIIAVLLLITIGLMFYFIIAAFAAVNVKKIDDLSNAMAIFQIPVIIGFLGGYMLPMMGMPELVKIARMIPFISAFTLPADIVVSDASSLELLFSFTILLATCIIVTVFTGKIYKKRLFG